MMHSQPYFTSISTSRNLIKSLTMHGSCSINFPNEDPHTQKLHL
uniref:Uncharacterized protein n=1 Tax=Nelumbo nucifera TaxID=4432 RepID=A0A822XE88_NELNU|nr:TPA_asm: hypothetical protein HUJ06_021227 [Nelumbo nucifera]